MRVASRPEPVPIDLAVVVDPDAEPVDLDQALAEFLLNYVRKRRSSVDASPADRVENNSEAMGG